MSGPLRSFLAMFPAILIIPSFMRRRSEKVMAEWQDYAVKHPGREHTVKGTLKLLEGFHSPQLDNERDLLVYLPSSYERGNRRYPVLYMHDGQNLFDAATSYAGEWQVDETMEDLGKDGLEAIVVGVPNTGQSRLDEYSPFRHPGLGGGKGDQYLDFLVQEIKPLIDAEYRTRPGREHTGIMGSSMGGLNALYAFFYEPKVFGFAGVMSPALWFGKGAIYSYIEKADFTPGRLYLDAGTREHGGDSKFWITMLIQSRRYYASVRRMQRLLVKKGYRPRRDLLYVEEKWARHEEKAWARRFPEAMRVFLNGNQRGMESSAPL